MGDSTAMTIEFLRARLLSERSVSRTAKQRADQLAKRVLELEEQLRIVTIQRKKAEKAATEVLVILETQGIGDLSEAIDSSSDQDDAPCVRGSDDTFKDDESSAASKMDKSEVEDGLSGSEHEISHSQGKSLSWKRCSNSSNSHDKQRVKEIRQRQRRRSFLSVQSPNHHSGKSCRKVKRKEMGSAESEKNKPTLSDESGGVPWSKSINDQLGKKNEAFEDTSVSHSLDDQNKEADIYANGNERDEEMERALEQQAQLIGQFQAEENAQREWEEKYNENNMSTPAYYEPGNQPEPTGLAERTSHVDEEAKLGIGNICSTNEPTAESLSSSEKSDRSKEAFAVGFSNVFMPRDLSTAPNENSSSAWRNGLVHQQSDGTTINESESNYQEFAFPSQESSGMIRNGIQDKKLLHANSGIISHNNERLQPHGHRVFEHSSTGSCLKLGTPGIQNHVQRQLPQAPSNSLGGVLEALQRAKLSLKQELCKLPSPSRGTLAVEAPTTARTRDITYGTGMGIPVGSPNLFRLPTDSFPEAQFSASKFLGSGLSLTVGRPDVGYASSSYGFQNPTKYMEGGSRIAASNAHSDQYFSSSLAMPASRMYSLPYSDSPADRAPFRSEFRKSYSDLRNTGDCYSLYGSDRTRSNMRMS